MMKVKRGYAKKKIVGSTLYLYKSIPYIIIFRGIFMKRSILWALVLGTLISLTGCNNYKPKTIGVYKKYYSENNELKRKTFKMGKYSFDAVKEKPKDEDYVDPDFVEAWKLKAKYGLKKKSAYISKFSLNSMSEIEDINSDYKSISIYLDPSYKELVKDCKVLMERFSMLEGGIEPSDTHIHSDLYTYNFYDNNKLILTIKDSDESYFDTHAWRGEGKSIHKIVNLYYNYDENDNISSIHSIRNFDFFENELSEIHESELDYRHSKLYDFDGNLFNESLSTSNLFDQNSRHFDYSHETDLKKSGKIEKFIFTSYNDRFYDYWYPYFIHDCVMYFSDPYYYLENY